MRFRHFWAHVVVKQATFGPNRGVNHVVVSELLTAREKLGFSVPNQRKLRAKTRQKCSLSSIFVLFAPPPPFRFFGAKMGGGAPQPPPFAPCWWLTFVENQCPPPPFWGRGHKTLHAASLSKKLEQVDSAEIEQEVFVPLFQRASVLGASVQEDSSCTPDAGTLRINLHRKICIAGE